MTRVTRYVSLPFFRSPSGGLVAGESNEAINLAIAHARAEGCVGRKVIVSSPHAAQPPTVVVYVGAIALSRTGDAETGGFDDPVILASLGETPEPLRGTD